MTSSIFISRELILLCEFECSNFDGMLKSNFIEFVLNSPDGKRMKSEQTWIAFELSLRKFNAKNSINWSLLWNVMKWASSHDPKLMWRKWNYQLLLTGNNLCLRRFFFRLKIFIHTQLENKLVDTFEWVEPRNDIPTWIIDKLSTINRTMWTHRKNGRCVVGLQHTTIIHRMLFRVQFSVYRRLILRFSCLCEANRLFSSLQLTSNDI